MRFHNNNSHVPDGDLDARMNPDGDGGQFGIIDLGASQFCLDSADDARRLLAAAARITAWFETAPAPHAFESVHGARAPFGPCSHCGHIKSAGPHAGPKPLVISDSAIEQAAYFAEPGNTVDDALAAQAAAS